MIFSNLIRLLQCLRNALQALKTATSANQLNRDYMRKSGMVKVLEKQVYCILHSVFLCLFEFCLDLEIKVLNSNLKSKCFCDAIFNFCENEATAYCSTWPQPIDVYAAGGGVGGGGASRPTLITYSSCQGIFFMNCYYSRKDISISGTVDWILT